MVKGSHHSLATRQLMASKRRGELNGFYGSRHSAVTLAKMRQATQRLWQGPTFRRRVAEGRRRAFAKRAEAQQ